MKYINKEYFVLLFLLFQFTVFSQTWEHWYGKEGYYVSSRDVFEHYDKGYIISGVIKPPDYINNVSWLIKTDINGDTIWTKILIGGESLFVRESSSTDDGGILLCGTLYDNSGEHLPFATKLNSCGEKEWCTLIDLNEDTPAGMDIIETAEGNIGFLVYSSILREKTHLYMLDPYGEVLWKTNVCSRDNYPDSRQTLPEKINLTNSGDFIIAGRVYWKNPWDDLFPIRNFFAKVDNNGIEDWVLPFGINDTIFGHAYNIVEKADGSLLGLGFYWPENKKNYLSHSSLPNNLNRKNTLEYSYANGMIMHMDKYGNELNYFIADFSDIDTNYRYQKFTSLQYIDSLAIIGGVFDNDQNINVGEIAIDTNFFDDNFNVYYKRKHPNNVGYNRSVLSFDNKVLFSSTDSEGDDRMFLTKLNQNLEQDSVYTVNYTYDSLCNHLIESGFIYFNDCNIITAINTPTPKEYQAAKQRIPLKIYPNPASNQLSIELENTEYYGNLSLQIIDILGVQVYESPISKGQNEFNLNVVHWQNALYLVQIVHKGKLLGSGRFIKM